MKNLLFKSFAILLTAFIIPLLIAKPLKEPEALPTVKERPIVSPAVSSKAEADIQTIKLSHAGEIIDISMSEYLIGVVAVEMPASFNLEALKAQAVASRTYAIYNIRNKKHGASELCDDFSCCSAYAGNNSLREKWGLNFNSYYAKIKKAVESTDGQYLTWEGEPILAAFHSSSYSCTESSENVWSSPMPYLKSVPSPETSGKVTNLFTTVYVTQNDFKEKILKKFPAAVFGSEPAKWIDRVLYSEGGRVNELTVGGVKLSGTQIRQLFNLRSAAFTLRVENGSIVFSVSGYGHGVGMSQYGANIMAAGGSSYEDILKSYYSGVQIYMLKGSINP